MKEDSNHKFYLVREDILPEAIKKTIKVKEILKHHRRAPSTKPSA